MKQEHFEILLERVEHNTEVSLEAISGTNQRLDRLENNMNQRFENVEKRLDRVEVAQIRFAEDLKEVKTDVAEIKTDVVLVKKEQAEVRTDLSQIKSDLRDVKRSSGLLHPIAKDHESRIQGLENNFQDHLVKHS